MLIEKGQGSCMEPETLLTHRQDLFLFGISGKGISTAISDLFLNLAQKEVSLW